VGQNKLPKWAEYSCQTQDRRVSKAEIEKYLQDLVFSDASGGFQPETEDSSGEYARQQNEVKLIGQSGRVFAIGCEAVTRALGRSK
jgi:hypothetical protein